MVVNSIKVFARLKKEPKLKETEYDVRKNKTYEDLIFHKSSAVDYINSKFRFYRIFDQNTDQNEIFESVAKPIGFNGTIFAYGQTGSGKTYTITGSTKKYQDRGIIPRSVQFIFSAIEKTEEKPMLYISYMEIYNEICYDLLHPKDSKIASRLEELPRVVVQEGKKGEVRLRNLSVLPVSTEEEAMRLLFLGDTNRAIAETPLNEYSSRSHCIFTIYVTSRPNDNRTLRYAKLNLVDLAGSERVYKSNITGTILNEAKHINLSLHFLQQVILALSESKRLHIPYRNSPITFILKDSLAGNSLTVMLATLAVSTENMLETISTCKFAQRVSLIKTEPVINEVYDPYQEILLLKNEIQELKKQLANRDSSMLKLERQPLTDRKKQECEKRMEEYLNSLENDLRIEFELEPLKYCFLILKNKIAELKHQKEDIEHSERKSKKLISSKGCKYHIISEEESINRSNNNNDSLLKEFMSNPYNCEEINYYTKFLSRRYEKAKLLALTIEECQVNINYIREKLDAVAKIGCIRQKTVLGRELEYQQNIYKQTLADLKELQHETLQLEAGLKKAKAKMTHRFNKWAMDLNNCKVNIMKKNKELHLMDDSIIPNKKNNDVVSEKSWNVESDHKLVNYKLCNCNECRSEYSVSQRCLQNQNYVKLRALTEHNLKCSGDGHDYYNVLDDNYCTTNMHRHKELEQEKSTLCFLPEFSSNNAGIKKCGSKCNCNKMHFSPTGNNSNRVCYETHYDNDCHGKNLTTHCTKSTYETNFSRDYDCSDRHYETNFSRDYDCSDRHCEESSYPNNLLSHYKYSYNPITPAATQSDTLCCCYSNNENYVSENEYCESKNTVYLQDTVNHLKSNQNVATKCTTFSEDCRFSPRHSGDYEDFNFSVSKNNYVEKGLKCVSVEASSVYLDTDLLPNKLDNNIAIKEPIIKIKTDKARKKIVTSPIRQETLSDGDDLSTTSLNVSSIEVGKQENGIGKLKETGKFRSQYTEVPQSPNKKYDIFLESDSDEFRKFMTGISLTGDEEIDKEICNFYRYKMCP